MSHVRRTANMARNKNEKRIQSEAWILALPVRTDGLGIAR